MLSANPFLLKKKRLLVALFSRKKKGFAIKAFLPSGALDYLQSAYFWFIYSHLSFLRKTPWHRNKSPK
jgi:hypothetical protein